MIGVRPANIDSDIDPSRIRSEIIKSHLTKMDSYHDPSSPERLYHFLDVQDRFFVIWQDTMAEFHYVVTEEDLTRYGEGLENGEDVRLPSYTTMTVPVLKMVYVPFAYRGRNLQATYLDFVKSIADEVGESFALFCDPFLINGASNAYGARQSFLAYQHNSISTPNNWLDLSVKQRQRFLDAGCRNVLYHDAGESQPFQHFMYLSEQATDEERRLAAALNLNYSIDYEKLESLRNGTR